MHGRVAKRVGRGRLYGLLASTSVAALLIGGGAPAAFAACQIAPGSDQALVSNSGAINCIRIDGIAVTGNVTNTNTGTLTATNPSLQSNGIIILNASVGGAVVNAGQITAAGYGNGIFVTNQATVSGGISNSGTITVTLGNGILIGSTSTISVTISSFGGGITNSGTITASTGTGIVVGDRSASNVTIKISSFSGGISNSGTIAAAINGIFGRRRATAVCADANGSSRRPQSRPSPAASAIPARSRPAATASWSAARPRPLPSTTNTTARSRPFSGGIANSGTISAGGIGILGGGTANLGANAGFRSVTISTFSGGISNGGTISAGNIGINVNDVSTFLGGITNSGTVTAAGGPGIAISNVAQFGSTSAAGGVVNTGTVSAAGAGISVANVATFVGNISNSGTITGATGVVIGAGVNLAAGAAIVNSGTITGSTLSINDTAASGPVTIDQTGGLISGNIGLSAAFDTVNITGGSIAGDIVGSGAGTLNFNLGAASTYTDINKFVDLSQVNVDNGTTLVLNSTGNSASAMSVSTGGTLSGTGTVATTLTVLTGGAFAPGNSTPGSSMNITGTLAFQPTTTYKIYLNPTTASFANVTGNATLDGTVDAVFSPGGYVSKQYTHSPRPAGWAARLSPA